MYVIVPAYNEEKTIAKVLKRLLGLKCSILVVCNGCTDNSVQAAIDFLQPTYTGHEVLNIEEPLGVTGANQAGIDYLRKNRARHLSDYVAVCDADYEVDPMELDKVISIACATRADVVLGQRAYDKVPRKSEKLISKTLGVGDALCCIRAYKWDYLAKIGYKHGLIYPIIASKVVGGKIEEEPINIWADNFRESPTVDDKSIYIDCMIEILELMENYPNFNILSFNDLFYKLVQYMEDCV